jgi:bifunctional DNase/RNase
VGGEKELMTDGSDDREFVQVRVNGLALDVTSNSPVVMLGPEDSEKVLPIWIGHFEAWAIAMEISGMPPKRPLTHDLLKSVIGGLEANVNRVEITELKDQTFYARVILSNNGREIEIDARPSDSIALALKTSAPIFVNPELFELRQPDTGERTYDPSELKERLKKINPEDFGKYSL